MLTGFDSKWINTLYLDKILVYEKLIQAFSRTNRLYGPEKPFGTIRYYRKPYTMQRNIEEAFKLYSGDRPLGLFADKLEHNLEKMNALYDDIGSIFRSAGIENFEKLPVDHTERGQFAKLFKQLNSYLEAAKIQGFTWNKLSYEFKNVGRKVIINLHLDETTYLILALRYKELFASGSGEAGVEDVPYEIDSYLTEINTGVIDANYMNSRFKKYIKALQDADTADVVATSPDKTHWDKNLFAYCDDNPVNRRDDGGDLWEYVVGKMIVGTVVGGLTGGISSMLDDAAAGKEVSLASFAKGFFPGMLSGAVSTAASLVMEGLVPLISILRAPKDAERAIRMAEVVASAICATISAIRNRESLPDALLSIGSAAAAAYISNRVSPSGHSAGAIIGGGITSFAVGGAVSSAKTAIHISINSSRNRGPARRVTV